MKKRFLTIAISCAMIISAASVGFTANAVNVDDSSASASAPFSETKTSGDYKYVVLADKTIEIQEYNGVDDHVVIPEKIDGAKVTSIGQNAFSDISFSAVTIPQTVTSIGEGAFCNNVSLASVDIPKSVKSIGDSAFYNCYELADVKIPDTVTAIDRGAFSGTAWLKSITDEFVVVGDSLLIEYKGTDSEVEIPDSVKVIAGGAFEQNGAVKSVKIPESVTTIYNSAFAYCGSLSSIDIPDSVTSIGD